MTHGPVVGGVIGAKKPVYDIWGNTVSNDKTGVGLSYNVEKAIN